MGRVFPFRAILPVSVLRQILRDLRLQLSFSSFDLASFLFAFFSSFLPVLSTLALLFPRFTSFLIQVQFPGPSISLPNSLFSLPLVRFSDPSSAIGLWAITLSVMSSGDQKPLPFVYQFAAGAVAGVSEVCACDVICCCLISSVRIWTVFTNTIVLLWFRFLLCMRNLICDGFDIG